MDAIEDPCAPSGQSLASVVAYELSRNAFQVLSRSRRTSRSTQPTRLAATAAGIDRSSSTANSSDENAAEFAGFCRLVW